MLKCFLLDRVFPSNLTVGTKVLADVIYVILSSWFNNNTKKYVITGLACRHFSSGHRHPSGIVLFKYFLTKQPGTVSSLHVSTNGKQIYLSYLGSLKLGYTSL